MGLLLGGGSRDPGAPTVNDLLFWMSVRREGGASSLRAKAAELLPPRGGGPARDRLAEWNLSQLAHVEFPPGGGWKVAPPVLAAGNPGSPGHAVLCGARTPGLLARLAAANGTVESQAQPGGPDVIRVGFAAPGDLIAVGEAARLPIQWNAPLAILAACMPPTAEQLEPRDVPVGAWAVSRFSRSGAAWVGSSYAEAATTSAGLFRFSSDRGSSYLLKEGGQGFAVQPAVGKYRVLTRRHRTLRYDWRSAELSVPAACRPPILVERALAVCSGNLATLHNGHIIYRGVYPRVAEAAAAVLRQRLY